MVLLKDLEIPATQNILGPSALPPYTFYFDSPLTWEDFVYIMMGVYGGL